MSPHKKLIDVVDSPEHGSRARLERPEGELRETDSLLRALFDCSVDAVFLTVPDGQILAANPAACAMFGMSEAEICSAGRAGLADPQDVRFGPAERERLRTGRLVRAELNFVRRNGERFPAEVDSVILPSNPSRSFVIMRDISRRKAKEAHRQKLQRVLTARGNSTHALLHAVDEASLLAEVCKIITEDCGYAMVWIGFAENDDSKTVRPMAHAGVADGYLDTLRISWADCALGQGPTGTAIRTGLPCCCRNMLTDPKFEPWRSEALRRGFASSLVVPLLEGATAFGAITIYSREPDPFSEDEIKLLSELAADLAYGVCALRLRAAHDCLLEDLKKSEELLRVASLAADVGVWNSDNDSGEIIVTASWRRLFGVPDGATMTTETWRSLVHPEDRDRVVNVFNEAKVCGQEYQFEYRILLPDGEVRWTEARGRATFDRDGRAIGMAGVNVNVTGRKRAEEALLRSEKLASVGRMAMGIAHEINNPLNAVMNTLYLARSNSDLSPTVREQLDVADDELKRIAHMTRQSLGFYREDSTPTNVSMRDIVDSALHVLQSRIRTKRANIVRHFGGDLRVKAIAGEVRQAFCNLLANSLDAIEDKGVIEIRVSSSHCRPNGESCIRITVADNGKGIAEASRPHIFEALFTTKDTTGTGLGLWITKEIVARNGGTIRFRSVVTGPRTGTVFSIFLPY